MEKTAPKILIYSTPYCVFCNALKEFLKEHKIGFEEIDVSKDKQALQDMVNKSGQMGVPVTDIEGKIVVGFDRDQIIRILNIKE